VRQLWRLPHYAGLSTYRGGVVGEGEWPALIDLEDWLRLQGIADARGEAVRNRARPGQRRSHHHLLAGLGRCGRCGAAMHALGNTPRRDGTHPRRYQCASARDADGTCDGPRIDAEQVERPFLDQLEAVTLDAGAWVEERHRARETDREQVRESIRVEERRLADLDLLEGKVDADYLRQVEAGDADAAEVATRGLRRVEREREQAAHRIEELREVLEAKAETKPVWDAWLDLYADLERALAGHVVGDTVADVNARLREALDRVVITPLADGSVRLQAVLSPAFMATLETTPEGFAEVSPINGGPTIERVGEGWAARLDAPPPLREVRAAPGW
jgi:hypothetical protein